MSRNLAGLERVAGQRRRLEGHEFGARIEGLQESLVAGAGDHRHLAVADRLEAVGVQTFRAKPGVTW